jgi:hypothetical protein
VPYSIERSRSGNGAHVWIFFDSPVLAVKARKLGNAILTEGMGKDTKNDAQSDYRKLEKMPIAPILASAINFFGDLRFILTPF